MKKFIKSFVILCIVYVITQGFCHKIVLASDNENDPSSITYSIPSETTLEQDKNSDDLSENSAVDTQNQNNIDLNKENSTQDTKSKTDTDHDEIYQTVIHIAKVLPRKLLHPIMKTKMYSIIH